MCAQIVVNLTKNEEDMFDSQNPTTKFASKIGNIHLLQQSMSLRVQDINLTEI